MSMRTEWFAASYTSVKVVGPDTKVGEFNVDPENYAVVIANDEVAVLEGTPDQLRAMLQKALNALPATSA